jgi:hypothetical protein
VSALAFIYGLSAIGRWLFGDPSLERGWSSTIVIIAALGGANMLMTGVIGLNVGRIYAEAKGRPLYIVERAIGFEDGPTAARRAAAAPSSRKGTGRGAGLPPKPRETNAGRSARRFALSSMIRRP